ncbi:MAG TPA: efflux RND transporter permease subunit, partial [Burkholderiaceae bacterium]|nr:efflux RND transporter permease subunit [Burkholderiaceae bacterium]
LDPARMQAAGITVADLRAALQSANFGQPVGAIVADNRAIAIEAGRMLRDADDVAELVVGVRAGRPLFLADVATVEDGPPPPERHVWYGEGGTRPFEAAAVTLQITKKPGENAVDVARQVLARVDGLRNTLIPSDVQVTVTRNYGETANDKAMKLISKLLFATASVVVLVWVALGWREAAIVGAAVVLTLTATLFASWAWGFTLNRVSLFALIFSIGILVDDAIVVVENIHRHWAMNISAQAHVAEGDVKDAAASGRSQNIHRHRALHPGKTLAGLIPGAVDEVGGPTILATLAVIAALLPMAFVSGLMGPYMSPIPINASMGMLISLAVAFIVTPWLSRLWLGRHVHAGGGLSARLAPLFGRVFRPFLDERRGGRHRALLWLAIVALIAVSVALPAFERVVLKMLPFDNKSEFQVVVDMPAGTPLERTAAALRDMTAFLATVPEVTNYQAYAGLAAPINFNGLVRQYYLRRGGEVGDIQVNLVDKSARHEQSHAIATRLRPELARIGERHGARVKVVEVPPGPPVMSPIVAEIYGPDDEGRIRLARAVREVFDNQADIVDVDDSTIADAPRRLIVVDRRKAALASVPAASIVATIHAGL